MSETPAWRYLLLATLFLGLAAYMLATGELYVDKQRTMIISRASNPLLYWPIVAVSGALGCFALRAGWRAMR